MITPQDRADIEQVLAEYGHIVDEHDWDRAHLVFSDDFVFDVGAPGVPNLNGIADIVATFKGRNMYAHHSTNVAIAEEDDGTVRVHSKFIGFPNEGQPVSGDYHDEFVKTPAGWRLRFRRAAVRARKFFD